MPRLSATQTSTRICADTKYLSCLTGQASSQEELETSSIFVSPGDQQVAFGISIPRRDPDSSSDNDDIYFSIAANSNLKWAGIGLGSSEMSGALYLIIYSSASGANVTLSPRAASGQDEPVYDPSIHIEAMAGTGITADGIMTFSGRCTNCRSWSGNAIDLSSDAQDCIYGLAPEGPMNSDDPAAPLNYHTRYGSFTIDLKQAVAASSRDAEPPRLGFGSSSGSTLTSEETTENWAGISHAIIMVFCFVGLLPLGIIFLRVMNKVRWHGINQTVAAVGIIIGTGVGIYDSLRYNRVCVVLPPLGIN